ncbi:hypothetical protein WA1_09595 [Scytonema hofmannii PCC 7110]|uniref:Uncharacterized protein n=1 Tax=Scytonema hofmannii PCC 7110 TaxID=128403 RepID=A0A139WRD0_9CYAN|nr:hypothetical protein [Scytonema hofmannii]KYC34990.1 hypothetical protein WA1_09595 [Scytonema hofmannii PCC 7110]
MKFSLNNQFSSFHRFFQVPKDAVLTLVLTSLLSWGFSGSHSTAFAIAQQVSRRDGSSAQLTQNTNQQSKVLPKRIAITILRDASKRSNVPIRDLQITQATPKTFSNPCVFKFGEVCTREFKPIQGWEVNVQVKNDSWTYHVDKSGSLVVLDPKVSASQPTTLPKALEDSILRDASKRSQIPVAQLKITQATQKTFGNPCEFNFGEVCTKEFNPVKGWEVVVAVGSQSWTYHVNESGSQVVLDPKSKIQNPKSKIPNS